MSDDPGGRGTRGWLSAPRASRAAKATAGVISAIASLTAIALGVTQLGGGSGEPPATPVAAIGAQLETIATSQATRQEYESAIRASPPATTPIGPDELPSGLARLLGFPIARRAPLAIPNAIGEVAPLAGGAYPPQAAGSVIDFTVVLEGQAGRTAYITGQVLDAARRSPAAAPAREVVAVEAEADRDTFSSNLFVPVPERDEPVVVRIAVWDDRGTRLDFADSEPFVP